MASVGIGLFCTPGVAATADTGVDYSFDAVAAAYGLDSTINNPSIPLGLTIEAAGPVAQAHLSSVNQSDGFAAFPYPGDSVVGVPGLVKGALLPGFPVPSYPVYVNSTAGDPPAESNFPGIELQSRSNSNSTTARAEAGTAAIGAVSTADVTRDDNGVAATATTTVQALSLGNLLSISGIQSTARAVLGPDGKVTTSSSMSIGRITVAGLNLTLPTQTPDHQGVPVPIPGVPSFNLPFPAIPLPLGGLTLKTPDIGFEDGNFTITLPIGGGQKFSLPTKFVLDLFKTVGIKITYQEPVKTATGIVAANLTVQTVLPSLPSNKYFNGATPVSFTIGRASASFASATATNNGGTIVPPSGIDSGPGTLPGLGTGGESGGSTDSGSGAPVDSPVALPGDNTVPDVPVETGGGTATPATSLPDQPTRLQVLASTRKLYSSLVPLYVAVIGIGVVGLFAGQFLRYLGVRSSWKS